MNQVVPYGKYSPNYSFDLLNICHITNNSCCEHPFNCILMLLYSLVMEYADNGDVF